MCASCSVFHYVISGRIQKISAPSHTNFAKMTINDSWKRGKWTCRVFSHGAQTQSSVRKCDDIIYICYTKEIPRSSHSFTSLLNKQNMQVWVITELHVFNDLLHKICLFLINSVSFLFICLFVANLKCQSKIFGMYFYNFQSCM